MEFPLIARELKNILKARGIKYAELAPRLAMSESGLKKLLNGVDCSISRLAEICDELNISMSNLIASGEHRNQSPHQLTERQQRAFIKRPELYYFFMALEEACFDADAVAKDFGLDPTSNLRYLNALEDMKLIKVHKSGRVKKTVPGIGIASGREMSQKVGWPLQERFLHHARSRKPEDGSRHEQEVCYANFKLDARTIEQLNRDMRQLLTEYALRSIDNETQYDQTGLKHQVVLVASAPCKVKDLVEIRSLPRRS